MLTCTLATSTFLHSTLTLTPVHHWMKHVETDCQFFFFSKKKNHRSLSQPPRWAVGLGAGWRTVERTTWAAVVHWVRGSFTDGHCVEGPLVRSLPDTEVSRRSRSFGEPCKPSTVMTACCLVLRPQLANATAVTSSMGSTVGEASPVRARLWSAYRGDRFPQLRCVQAVS